MPSIRLAAAGGIVLALVAGAAPSFAAPISPPAPVVDSAKRSVVGTVTAINGGAITVRLPDGASQTYQAGRRTMVSVWGQSGAATLAAVTVGSRVSIATGGQQNPTAARRIIVLPAGQDGPSRPPRPNRPGNR
jgi:hypothetical protein